MTNDAITVIYNCSALLLLWAVWHFGWYHYCQDELRQRLFSIRDELFDRVARKELALDFNSPAYIRMRRTINNQIRLAHKFDTLGLVFVPICRWLTSETDDQDTNADPLVEVMKIENNDTRQFLRSVDKEASRATFFFLIKSSPAFACWLALFTVFLLVKVAVRRGAKQINVASLKLLAVRTWQPVWRAVEKQADDQFERDAEACTLAMSRESAHA